MDGPALVVHRSINELVYDTLGSSQAEQGGTAGTAASAVVPPGDDLILKLFAKIERIENFVKSQRQGDAASLLPKRTRKGLSGYRVGSRPNPHVGFDTRQKKAIPQCPRCPTAGDGHKYHTWDDCPLGGKLHAAGTMRLSASRSRTAHQSLVQATFVPPVSAVVAATTANDAPSFSYSVPSDEFAGVAAAVHGGGGSAVAREPGVCYGQAFIYSAIDTRWCSARLFIDINKNIFKFDRQLYLF
ncbi:hypothetical protein CYMTET_4681 [Cymbomonas tetramitiformis]|uniref:Uncharacterized protein n=1 Tax=Cymbomonas tetramitiformis TaxID=36881 RepID=A0AAE0LK52_9CHLO|nr:hypothetical protein CYMTET_4681 [Cymbomonas tetramitiformis]